MIVANCYKKIGYEEDAFKLYKEISNKDLKKEEFDKVEQHFRETNEFKNDLGIWKYIKMNIKTYLR
ncbi:16206_t:CDS:1, partial [Dentiscutata heterogama]